MRKVLETAKGRINANDIDLEDRSFNWLEVKNCAKTAYNPSRKHKYFSNYLIFEKKSEISVLIDLTPISKLKL